MFKPLVIEKKDGETVETVTLRTPEELEQFQAEENAKIGQKVFAVKVRRIYSIQTQNYEITDAHRGTWPSWMRNMVVSVSRKRFSITGTQAELDRFVAEFNAWERKRA